MESPSRNNSYRNSLLASLPPATMNQIATHLVPMTFKRNQILCHAEREVEDVYFLEDGVCSVVVTMQNGSTIEIGLIGREGFVGVSAVLGTGISLHQAFIQLPGSGFSIKARTLRKWLSEPSSELRLYLERGIEAYLAQASQTAACNRVHELEERLARWLLMCHDRMMVDNIPLTHEFLAVMLGTRRSSVTLAVGMLQKVGLIKGLRGQIKIANRKGLEKVACECYSVIRDVYARLKLLESR